MRLDTFRLLESSEGATFVLHPVGELDYYAAAQLRTWLKRYLRKGPLPTTLVDLSQLSFVDSGGLGALIELWKRVADSEHHVLYANPQTQPMHLLRITGLATRLPVYETVAEAFTSITREAADRHSMAT